MSDPKSVFAPSIQRSVKFGRRRPAEAQSQPQLYLCRYGNRVLRGLQMPTLPAYTNYRAKADKALRQMYLNDQLGDCVVAAGYHVEGVATFNAGEGLIATKSQIVADYSAISGYDPRYPSSDQGCDEETAISYWTQRGFANGTRLAGSLAVDATNVEEIKTALYLFENLFFGVELPNAWISPFPEKDGFIWDLAGEPRPENGHAFNGIDYDDEGVIIDTWALDGPSHLEGHRRLLLARQGWSAVHAADAGPPGEGPGQGAQRPRLGHAGR